MRFRLIPFAFVLFGLCHAQYKMTTREYIDLYSSIAVRQMSEYKIPASIILAQGILESGHGGGRLATVANNHFGIKCGSKWTGSRIYHDDDSRAECFRQYRSAEESYRDHSLFLTQNQRYSGLFSLDLLDYKGWSHGLKAAGYATNPQYPVLLIRLIEDNELWKYDRDGAVGAKKKLDGLLGWLAEKNSSRASVSGVNKVVKHEKLNGVRYVFARDGDSFESISQRTGVSVKKLLKYNDIVFSLPLDPGMAVYVGPKKSRSRTDYMHHTVKGETMHSISQRYGITLQALRKLNPSYGYNDPVTGTYLRLR